MAFSYATNSIGASENNVGRAPSDVREDMEIVLYSSALAD